MSWSVVAAHPRHINRVANAMRVHDRLECRALGVSPKHALRRALKASVLSWTILHDGKPMAMFGVAPANLMEGIGSPWLLSADGIEKAIRQIVKVGPRFVEAMQDDFPRLENMIAVENRGGVWMIRSLGFELEGDVVHIGGVPFRRFSRVRPCASIPQR